MIISIIILSKLFNKSSFKGAYSVEYINHIIYGILYTKCEVFHVSTKALKTQ